MKTLSHTMYRRCSFSTSFVLNVFRFLIEFLNLFRRWVGIGNINISRRPECVPDHAAPVLYPFVTVLSVGAGGGVSVQFSGNFLRRVSGTAHVQSNSRVQP